MGGLERVRRSRTVRTRCAAAVRGLATLALAGGLSACVTEESEQRLGDSIAKEINQQVPLLRDPPLNRYVARLGQEIAHHSARPDLKYHFYIVDTDAVNAFALPGGHIYINRGLIERTENSSELAGILAHEIGHVAARHGARNLERHLRSGSLMALMYKLFRVQEPELVDPELVNLGGTLWSAAHSRSAETEADKLAVGYLIRSGIDPQGMVSLMDALLAEEGEQPASAPSAPWFSTHPTTESRVQSTRKRIRESIPKPRPRLVQDIPSYPSFLRRLEALPPPPPQLRLD